MTDTLFDFRLLKSVYFLTISVSLPKMAYFHDTLFLCFDTLFSHFFSAKSGGLAGLVTLSHFFFLSFI